jgi:heme-degrading monooxygenase HmoA
MITEIAVLKILAGQSGNFEASFEEASEIISSMNGYVFHELLKCVEQKDQYILIVRWEKLEDHTIGFRKSEAYQKWKELLHHFYDPFPVVEHYTKIN